MSESNQSSDKSGLSRRGFLGTAAVAAAGLAANPSYASKFHYTSGYLQQTARTNSKFGNVQIGTITYSYRSLPGANDAEQVLQYLVLSGISSTELMGGPITSYLGQPAAPAGLPNQQAIDAMTDPAQKTAAQRQRDAYTAELNRWYASPDMTKLAALRKMFNDQGVTIHLTKLGAGTPEAAHFAFKVSRALGARGNSAELSVEAAQAQGPIAAQYGQFANLHNHAQPGQPGFSYEPIVAVPGASINMDVGHFYGATGRSPVPEIIKYNQRIVSFHLKDKTSPVDGNQNQPWGQGATPLAEILRLVHRENYNINADIELEYAIPEDSNAVIESRKCIDFCREVLTRYTSYLNTPRPAPGGGAGGGGGGGGAAPAPGGAPTSAPRP